MKSTKWEVSALSENTRVQSSRNTSTPDTGQYGSVASGFEDIAQTETVITNEDTQFLPLGSRSGEYWVTRIDVVEQRELAIRERIKKFLQD
jgi:hypothetical protein